MRPGLGIRNPLFFIGVVENNRDGTLQGRIQVRVPTVHGTHEEVATQDLPWAICVSGHYDPNSPIPPLNSFVYGMFTDGDEAQHPLVLGMIPTQYVEQMYPSEIGYGVVPVDEDGKVNVDDPLAKGFRPDDIGEHQSAKVRRGELAEETIHKQISTDAIQRQRVADKDPSSTTTWNQPPSAYAAKYPYNRVVETAAHTIELDDSPGAERIMIHHKSGAFVQIDAIGTVTERAEGDRYEINIGTKHESSGHSVVTINGNSHVYVRGHKTEEIEGDYKLIVRGNAEIASAGQLNLNASDQLNARAATLKLEANADTMTIFAKDEIRFEAEKQLNFVSQNIKNTALLNYDVYCNKSIKLTTPWNIHAQASNIIMSANGLIPPGPTGGATPSTPGFHLTSPTINIGGFAGTPALGSFNGLWNASIINGGVVTGTNVNATTLQATGLTAGAATFGLSTAMVLRAASYSGPLGTGAAVVPPPVIALPTIPLLVPPAQSLLIPPPLDFGISSGYAWPTGNGDGFAQSILSSPLTSLGFKITPLTQGGLGIPRIQMPEPISKSCSVILKQGYFARGHAGGYITPIEEYQNVFNYGNTFDTIQSLTGESVFDILPQAAQEVLNVGDLQIDANGVLIIEGTDLPELPVNSFTYDANTGIVGV